MASTSHGRQSAAYREHQPSFDDLGQPLPEVTFVVVDLETTGSTAEDTITEIGAVKVRGGEVLGEFHTLVNPQTHIPPLIAVLTGITNQMVSDAPTVATVLPSFLEFSRGCVLVAHNAGFDVGFLKRCCEQLGHPWPAPAVVDTVALARQALLRDEVANCKLSTLARFFASATEPNHRALTDARATVDVLHGLLARIGNLGVTTLEDLHDFTRRVSPQRRAKRTWANDLPDSPGVYSFYADLPAEAGGLRREVLYVGKAVNLKRRVRSYFTAAETRARMDEMVRVSTGVDHVECATDLEAEVRELRMIAAHSPRYNRRSRRQDKVLWVRLTREAFPRLSVVRQVTGDAFHWGPFPSRAAAEEGILALYDTFPIRQCTKRLSATKASSSCALAEMGRCPAPCELGAGAEEYSAVVQRLRDALQTDVRPVVRAVGTKLNRLATQHRFEEAAELTQRLSTYTHTTRRLHRITSVAGCAQMVAARRLDSGWELHVFRYGRLAAAGHCRWDGNPQAMARELVVTAETVPTPVGGIPAGSIEECERIAHWLELPGVRFIELTGEWAWPAHVGLAEGALAELAAVSLAG